MLKKLLIAAIAVIAGTMVVSKMTKISPTVWFSDCCRSARNMVPPEVQLKQLKTEINNIDKDLSNNLSRLARMKAEVDVFAEELDAKRDRQAKLRADISDLKKSLDNGTERVVFRGRKVEAEDLTRRLDMAVTEYTCLKEQVKAHDQVLTSKKRTLEVAKNRIAEMKNEKEKLRLLAAKLETHLEMVKMKQMENQVVDFDESAVSQARQTARDIEMRLREAEAKMKLEAQFGLNPKSIAEKDETKSKDEVLRAAKAALQDDNATEEVLLDKNLDNNK
jgi:chromosome segregation ATPase